MPTVQLWQDVLQFATLKTHELASKPEAVDYVALLGFLHEMEQQYQQALYRMLKSLLHAEDKTKQIIRL